ncbi:hypothetical protein cyc_01533 [Cyclospora cayetanensis]|uniref:Transmembrane protein n=1 Tax=Cyclospora cayetanensis TaxID=88456 RepID=A0A1D3D721_9EIME|nr:hypothetical protein cyc_01533 [Cyclospora cayetanensis]
MAVCTLTAVLASVFVIAKRWQYLSLNKVGTYTRYLALGPNPGGAEGGICGGQDLGSSDDGPAKSEERRRGLLMTRRQLQDSTAYESKCIRHFEKDRSAGLFHPFKELPASRPLYLDPQMVRSQLLHATGSTFLTGMQGPLHFSLDPSSHPEGDATQQGGIGGHTESGEPGGVLILASLPLPPHPYDRYVGALVFSETSRESSAEFGLQHFEAWTWVSGGEPSGTPSFVGSEQPDVESETSQQQAQSVSSNLNAYAAPCYSSWYEPVEVGEGTPEGWVGGTGEMQEGLQEAEETSAAQYDPLEQGGGPGEKADGRRRLKAEEKENSQILTY